MSNDSIVRYAIDAEDNICLVDEGWCQFAEANDGAELVRPAILGQSLCDHISDTTTSRLYQQIISRVRQGKLARFTFRCDGPAYRRLLEMKIRSGSDGAVELETQLVREENREPEALLSGKITRSSEQLRVCAWCNRMNVGYDSNDWVAVEDASERLRLFELERLPQLTHGMCETCLASMTDTLDNMDANTG